MDNDNQVVEATNSTEEVVIEETNEVEETPEVTETVEQQEKTYSEKEFKAVLARAKKAEAALKTKPKETINNVPEELIEEKILKSQGMSDELLAEAKALAKVRGKSLLEIQNDPLLIAIKETRERDAKEAKAKLGASKGSTTVKKEKGFNTKDLTEDEHKELWKRQMGR